jgi:hypothetical protein
MDGRHGLLMTQEVFGLQVGEHGPIGQGDGSHNEGFVIAGNGDSINLPMKAATPSLFLAIIWLALPFIFIILSP